MIRKVVKAVAWAVGAVAGLAVVVYLAALAVNWRDREPSPAATRLSSLYRNPPEVADADNAYVYFMGFHAPRDQDPFEAGVSRVAWVRAAGEVPVSPDDDPLPASFESGNMPHVDGLLTPCRDNATDCVEALDVSATAFDAWVATDGWWLERYRALLARPAWQDIVPVNGSAGGAFPNYLSVSKAQTALLINVSVLAERGDAAEVKALLASDARFWRTALESSNVLTTKMIAAGALRRSFEWGNLALRKLPRASASAAAPDEWRVPFSDSERSLSRAIASQWQYATRMLPGSPVVSAAPMSPSSKAFGFLYRRQDTLNRLAEYYSGAADVLDAPLEGYAAALTRTTRLSEALRAQWPPRSLYNVIGTELLAAGTPDLADYAARVTDLEGVRRGALTAVTLRIEGVQPADVPAALRTMAPPNPYDGEPLLWDEAHTAIVFRGLERSTRREHRFYF
jgi:hypothetical protein